MIDLQALYSQAVNGSKDDWNRYYSARRAMAEMAAQESDSWFTPSQAIRYVNTCSNSQRAWS